LEKVDVRGWEEERYFEQLSKVGVIPNKTASSNHYLLQLRQKPEKDQPVAQITPRMALHRKSRSRSQPRRRSQTPQGTLPMGRHGHDCWLQTRNKENNRWAKCELEEP